MISNCDFIGDCIKEYYIIHILAYIFELISRLCVIRTRRLSSYLRAYSTRNVYVFILNNIYSMEIFSYLKVSYQAHLEAYEKVFVSAGATDMAMETGVLWWCGMG